MDLKEAMVFGKVVGKSRWFVLYASFLIISFSGATYIFGLYSPAIKSALQYDQKTLNTLGFFKDLGANLGIISGLLNEVTPAWFVLAVGGVMNLTGFLLVWLSVTGRMGKPERWQMFTYIAIGSNSQTFTNTGALVTCVKNFPQSRGIVLGILKGFAGLSGAIFTQIYHALYGDHPASLILLIGWLPCLVCLTLMFIVRPTDPAPELKELNRFYYFLCIALALAGFLMIVIILQNHIKFPPLGFKLVAAAVVVFLVLPLSVVAKAEWDRVKAQSKSPALELAEAGGVNDKERFYKLGAGKELSEQENGKVGSGKELSEQENGKLRSGKKLSEQERGKLRSGKELSEQEHGKLGSGKDVSEQEQTKLGSGRDVSEQEQSILGSGKDLAEQEHGKLGSGKDLSEQERGKLGSGKDLSEQERGKLGAERDLSETELGIEKNAPHVYNPPLKLEVGADESKSRLFCHKRVLLNLKEFWCTRPKRGEDFTIPQAMVSMDMWIIFIATTCGVGAALTAVDNMGQIGHALGFQPVDVSTFVSLMSIWNFLGRVTSGFCSEVFLQKYNLPRPMILTFVLSFACVGHLFIAFALPGSLYVASVILGFSFGAQWPVIFAIISEFFGLKYYATLYNLAGSASPLGTYILSVRVAGYLYDLEVSKQNKMAGERGGNEILCNGVNCFRLTFIIMTLVSLFGALISGFLVIRTRDFYKGDLYANYQSYQQQKVKSQAESQSKEASS